MGYFHGYAYIQEWAEATELKRCCAHCGGEFIPHGPTSKFCYDPECESDRYYDKLWEKGNHPLQLDPDVETDFLLFHTT